MSAGDQRSTFLYKLPPPVLWEFCLVMDGLSDLDWTRFASEVLGDQTAVRLAEKRERRTDWVMNQWCNRNGSVGELLELLERLEMLRPRDVILRWASSLKPSPVPPLPSHKQSEATPTLSTVRVGYTANEEGGRPLPRPPPPPPILHSDVPQTAQPPQLVSSSSGVMCWSYEEVHAGTGGFSPSLQVGEGGFGVVYRASLRNTDCAVKRLKQDCLLDWIQLRESFQNEVDQLSKFRHPHIVDLLGFSEGPETVCLIYSYMELRSLEDQLHKECVSLTWSQRVGVVKGASAALQFLHFPPDGHAALIHGDVKSSNILLDRHLVAKLADFGLARLAHRRPAGRSAGQTASVGKTATVRGTLAYLPVEYVRNGELGTAVDVYSFGVVLLEVLTGRRALELGRKSGETYLKDLVEEVEENLTGSSAEAWRKQLDHRLIPGDAAEPPGCMELVDLACKCLDKKRKKRPAMTEVFDKLQNIHVITCLTGTSPLHHPDLHPPSLSLPKPPHPLDSSVGPLSNQLSKLGPLEDTYQLSQSSLLSSFCSLTAPHSSSSLTGPCETDESQGFSQYDIRSQFRSNETSSNSPSPATRDHYHCPTGPTESQEPSVPSEDQYNFPPPRGPDTKGLCGVPECFSPVGPLQSLSPEPSGPSAVLMIPSQQRFLHKEQRIQAAQLLSSDNLYGGRRSDQGPEESDEYLPAQHD
uniref:interleukin-1 receptor-associated kinase 1 isoform X1 n=1 Tax=Gasterosteus aculeatus aculeatus TaxID=481459 RepID=UPI001A99B6B9|nr:interleukin-1 receptor-associated kinase 1 isoform X1 [Gasterosteus aculeatus aculeatus]